MQRSVLLTVLAVTAVLVACSSDDASSSDPSATCTSICTKSGFTSGRADVQPNEINCFCSGGTGEVTAAICTEGCTGLGKAKSQPFGNNGAGGKPGNCQCE